MVGDGWVLNFDTFIALIELPPYYQLSRNVLSIGNKFHRLRLFSISEPISIYHPCKDFIG